MRSIRIYMGVAFVSPLRSNTCQSIAGAVSISMICDLRLHFMVIILIPGTYQAIGAFSRPGSANDIDNLPYLEVFLNFLHTHQAFYQISNSGSLQMFRDVQKVQRPIHESSQAEISSKRPAIIFKITLLIRL